MAQNDDAVLTAAVGYVYVGPVGTAAPSPAALKGLALDTPEGWAATGWTSVGHTSRGTLPEFGFDGGDLEMKGSWQKKKLREIMKDDAVDYLTVVLHQFDEAALALYYGENNSAVEGVFGVASGAGPLERAGFVVIEDGDVRLGFHFHKSNVKRDDKIELPIDDLAALPIKFTFLDHNSEDLFSWINEDMFNAAPSLPVLALGSATGGTYTLKVNGVATASIAYGANAAAIKSALVAVDDGISASQVTVTADGSDFEIDIPAVLTIGVDSTTGGTGITLS